MSLSRLRGRPGQFNIDVLFPHPMPLSHLSSSACTSYKFHHLSYIQQGQARTNLRFTAIVWQSLVYLLVFSVNASKLFVVLSSFRFLWVVIGYRFNCSMLCSLNGFQFWHQLIWSIRYPSYLASGIYDYVVAIMLLLEIWVELTCTFFISNIDELSLQQAYPCIQMLLGLFWSDVGV